ncbi:MAG: PEP-CTERM sorting domain-containing protein, partial [Lentisphaeria bacterium]|nr:PEP-CTERM sorting domain-containing protein [Lentisphaeria bacterium]
YWKKQQEYANELINHDTSGNAIFGTINGIANTTLNLVVGADDFRMRTVATNMLGHLNISTSSSDARINLFNNYPNFGPGTTTLGDKVAAFWNQSSAVHDSATLVFVGGTGTNAIPKMNIGNRTDTIANLVVDSPGTLTGTRPLLSGSTGRLTVSNTVTFQGTAGTVEIDDTQATPSGNRLATNNLTFNSTGGAWTVQGDGAIGVTGTITTNVDASIANRVNAASGFTKAGDGTLTLDNVSGIGGDITISAGTLAYGGSGAGSLSLNGGNTFTHSGTGTVTVTDGTSGFTGILAADGGGILDISGEDFSGVAAINISGGSTLEAAGATATVTLDGGTVSIGDSSIASMTGGIVVGAGGGILSVDLTGPGSSDQVLGTLDVSGGVLNLAVNALGPVANGDSFTVFTGAVTGPLSNIQVSGDFSSYWDVAISSLILTSTIPEPSTMLLAGLGLLGVTFRRRRK